MVLCGFGLGISKGQDMAKRFRALGLRGFGVLGFKLLSFFQKVPGG